GAAELHRALVGVLPLVLVLVLVLIRGRRLLGARAVRERGGEPQRAQGEGGAVERALGHAPPVEAPRARARPPPGPQSSCPKRPRFISSMASISSRWVFMTKGP